MSQVHATRYVRTHVRLHGKTNARSHVKKDVNRKTHSISFPSLYARSCLAGQFFGAVEQEFPSKLFLEVVSQVLVSLFLLKTCHSTFRRFSGESLSTTLAPVDFDVWGHGMRICVLTRSFAIRYHYCTKVHKMVFGLTF